MKSQLSKLEKITLYWVSMDHETLGTIIGNVSNDFGKKIGLKDLHITLLGLQAKGLVDSYAYSAKDQKYVEQAPVGSYPQKDIWWFINDAGVEALENI